MSVHKADCGGCEVSRRVFVERTALAALATMLVNACGDGEVGGPLGSQPPPPVTPGGLVVRLANFPALAEVGGTARVDGSTETPIGVSRVSADSFVAVSMICTHAGFKPIDIQPVGYRCPNHGALFADDGTWTGGQATTNLERYTVVYDASAGTLTIT